MIFNVVLPVIVMLNCSAYTPSVDEGCREDALTASGVVAQEGVTVACDHLPFGTKVRIGDHIYTVQDRFGGGYTDRLDIFMLSKERALEFGRRNLLVEIIEDEPECSLSKYNPSYFYNPKLFHRPSFKRSTYLF